MDSGTGGAARFKSAIATAEQRITKAETSTKVAVEQLKAEKAKVEADLMRMGTNATSTNAVVENPHEAKAKADADQAKDRLPAPPSVR